jgi:hypothetical protein
MKIEIASFDLGSSKSTVVMTGTPDIFCAAQMGYRESNEAYRADNASRFQSLLIFGAKDRVGGIHGHASER